MEYRRTNTMKIVDDLAALPISRQRKYQIRNMREGRCIICGKDAYKDTLFCFEHNVKRGITQPGRNRSHAKKWM